MASGDIYENLGKARAAAQKWADRDSCDWFIYTRNSSVYPYQIFGQHEKPAGFILMGERKVETITPGSRTLKLTKEEAELVEYILREDVQTISPEADSTKVRRSTWKKVKDYLNGK
jgi:arylamine N-acetyltransferase